MYCLLIFQYSLYIRSCGKKKFKEKTNLIYFKRIHFYSLNEKKETYRRFNRQKIISRLSIDKVDIFICISRKPNSIDRDGCIDNYL